MTAPSRRRLRAGVIGLGVGEAHIDGYRRAHSVDVTALCDQSPTVRERLERDYPECRIYGEAQDLLDDPEVDVVSIASYDQSHASLIVAAFEAGKHVFAEKPLCLKESELQRIRSRHAAAPNLQLSTNTVLRKSPRFLDLKNRIADGELGEIYYLEADYNYGRLEKLLSGWRGEDIDYSVVLGGGIHMVDLALWLTGARVVEVMAAGNKICSRDAPFRTPDLVVATLRFDTGAIAKIACNFGCVQAHFHRLIAYGTHATYENTRPGGLLYRSRSELTPPETIATDYPGVRKGDLIPSFIAAIRGEGPADVSAAEAYAATEVCLAIERSWRTGTTVRLPDEDRHEV